MTYKIIPYIDETRLHLRLRRWYEMRRRTSDGCEWQRVSDDELESQAQESTFRSREIVWTNFTHSTVYQGYNSDGKLQCSVVSLSQRSQG